MAVNHEQKIGAVVVLFHPNWELFVQVFSSYSYDFEVVWVVANSELSKTQRNWLQEQTNVQLLQNPDNVGIGRALNQAFAQAHARSMDWMLTMDQDSGFQPGGIQDLKLGLLAVPAKCAAYGANPLWHDRVPSVRSEKKVIIQSGAFWSLKAWSELGGFHEGLFMDGVDHEFCLRSRKSGWSVHTEMNIALLHALGQNLSVPTFLWRWHPWRKSGLTYYHAAREYFLIRNTAWLIGSYFLSDPLWSSKRSLYLVQRVLYALFILPDKRHRIPTVARALKDVFKVPPNRVEEPTTR
jgi:rhamnosyltransferase